MRRRALIALAWPACACVATLGLPPRALAQRAPAVAAIGVYPPDARVQVGSATQLIASAFDRAGNALLAATSFSWISSNPRVASVDANGVASGLAPGVTIISARWGTGRTAKSGRATLQVFAAAGVPATVQIQPSELQVQAGRTTQAFVTAYDRAGNPLISATTFTWRSNNPNVASVDSNGIVTGHAPGVTLIIARYVSGQSVVASDPATVEVLKAGAAPVPPR